LGGVFIWGVVSSEHMTKSRTKKPVPKKIDPIERFRGERQAAATKKENRTLLKRLEESEARSGVAEALRAAKTPKPIKAKKLVNLHKRVATLCFCVVTGMLKKPSSPKR
jgi:hypothetical protein